MPQDGLLFRVLRRFNILWVAIAGLVIIAASGYQLYKDAYLRHHIVSGFITEPRARPASPAAGALSIIPDNYGSPETEYRPWSGKVFVAMRFNAPPDPSTPESFKDYVPQETVNVLVIDAKAGAGAWLFPTNKQTITARDAVYDGAAKGFTQPDSDTRPVLGMVMMVTATGKDGKPEKDTSSVYVWTKQSAKTVKLFVADKVLSYDQSGSDRYLILYQTGKETRVATYSIPDFKQLSDKRVPDAPK